MQPVVNADQPPKPSVSVVIGSLNRRDFLAATIATVRTELPPDELEIIVVDGGSEDGTLEWLLEQKDVITVVQHNKARSEGGRTRRSWGYFMNLGFRAATAGFKFRAPAGLLANARTFWRCVLSRVPVDS